MRKILEAELDRLTEQNARPEVRAAAARRLVNFEPTHEGAVRSLMKAFAQMGDRAQAIREFERCRQVLLSMLDLPPFQGDDCRLRSRTDRIRPRWLPR